MGVVCTYVQCLVRPPSLCNSGSVAASDRYRNRFPVPGSDLGDISTGSGVVGRNDSLTWVHGFGSDGVLFVFQKSNESNEL